MVVTGSRLQAVRYKLEIDKYIREKGYTDIKALVAFSGEVIDPDIADKKYTEVGMNGGIREKRAAGEVRDRRISSADRRREIPDRLRPAAAAHDVRRQAARRRAGRADACRGSTARPRARPTRSCSTSSTSATRSSRPSSPTTATPRSARCPTRTSSMRMQHELEASPVIDKAGDHAVLRDLVPQAARADSGRAQAAQRHHRQGRRALRRAGRRRREGRRSRPSWSASATSTPSSRRSSPIRIPIWRSSTPTAASC